MGARKTMSQNDPKQPHPGGRVPACPVSPACQLPRPRQKGVSCGERAVVSSPGAPAVSPAPLAAGTPPCGLDD